MKIHERLKSKAVDIHIQKMASLTLNGAPLRAATNQYQRKGENARARARARERETERALAVAQNRTSTARVACALATLAEQAALGLPRRHRATLLLGMRRRAIDRSRPSFRVVSFGKGVTRPRFDDIDAFVLSRTRRDAGQHSSDRVSNAS